MDVLLPAVAAVEEEDDRHGIVQALPPLPLTNMAVIDE